MSSVLAEFDDAWIGLFQDLFHPWRAHEVLKEWLLNGACLDDSFQVANCIVGRSFGDGSAKTADPVRIVRVPSRAVSARESRCNAAQRRSGNNLGTTNPSSILTKKAQRIALSSPVASRTSAPSLMRN
jgi:hypothetical protein